MAGRGGTDDKIVRINVKKKSAKRKTIKKSVKKTASKAQSTKKKVVKSAKKRVAKKKRAPRRTVAQLEVDYKKISKLYFVQCWKVSEIAQVMGLAVRTIEADLAKIKQRSKDLPSQGEPNDLRKGILDGIQERFSERVRNLWNEYVDLTTRINKLENVDEDDSEEVKKRKKNFTAISLRKMRLKILEVIRKEDSDLVERLRKMGILEGEVLDEEDENEIMAEVRRRYEDIQKRRENVRRDVVPPRNESEGTRVPSRFAGNRSVNGDIDGGDNG